MLVFSLINFQFQFPFLVSHLLKLIFFLQLVIGNFGLSYEQAKVQMVIWAILAAPLIMSHDLRSVSPLFRNILLNPALIQINQDPVGLQGKRIYIVRNILYFNCNTLFLYLYSTNE